MPEVYQKTLLLVRQRRILIVWLTMFYALLGGFSQLADLFFDISPFYSLVSDSNISSRHIPQIVEQLARLDFSPIIGIFIWNLGVALLASVGLTYLAGSILRLPDYPASELKFGTFIRLGQTDFSPLMKLLGVVFFYLLIPVVIDGVVVITVGQFMGRIITPERMPLILFIWGLMWLVNSVLLIGLSFLTIVFCLYSMAVYAVHSKPAKIVINTTWQFLRQTWLEAGGIFFIGLVGSLSAASIALICSLLLKLFVPAMLVDIGHLVIQSANAAILTIFWLLAPYFHFRQRYSHGHD